jgi:hypothetical protein
MTRSILLAVILSVRAFGLYAQATATESKAGNQVPQELVPQDTEVYWSVAIARFQGFALAPENLYLTHSLPLLLRERLSGIHTHYFSNEERLGYQKWILAQEQRRLGQALQLLREERDDLFFRNLSLTERSEKLANYDEKIEDAIERINSVKNIDPARVEFPDQKEIQFKLAEGGEATGADGEAAEMLVEAPTLSPLRIARHEQVNLLIWGTLEEIQGYLYLTIRALDAHLGREVFYYSDAAEPEDLYRGLEEATAELSGMLWGREWASLAVETTPAGARVFVNGVYAGRAPVELDYLLPGSVELRVEAPGFRREDLRVDLVPYAQTRELVVLEALPEDVLRVTSDPEGALVYNGSRWIGVTPLEVQRPESLSRFVLRLEGYRERVLYVGEETEGDVSIVFHVDEPDPVEIQLRRRDRFYTAFGFFAASVPIPFFLWAAANDSYGAFLEAVSPVEAQRLADRVEVYYNSYLATLGVSVALFVNMMVHLVRYIRSADRQG